MKNENLIPVFKKTDDIKDFKLDDNFEESGINFVAIDLETATFSRNSICEIGIAVVEKGEIVLSKSWLVRPPENNYFDFNIRIHGIKPEDTEECPEFKEVWKEVKPFVNGKVLVAHNTSFDMYVLKDSFLSQDLEMPEMAFFCSYRLVKKVVRNCYSYTLNYVCDALEIEMERYHRAESDAVACAKVFIECLKRIEAKSFVDLQDILDLRCGRFSKNYFRPQRVNKHYDYKKGIDVSSIEGDPDKIDEDSYFYNKVVCFTGKCMYAIRKDLLQMIADIGGIPADSVTAKTDILVVGQQDYRVVGESGMSSKQKKAISLKDKGQDIEILSEAEFLSMISR